MRFRLHRLVDIPNQDRAPVAVGVLGLVTTAVHAQLMLVRPSAELAHVQRETSALSRFATALSCFLNLAHRDLLTRWNFQISMQLSWLLDRSGNPVLLAHRFRPTRLRRELARLDLPLLPERLRALPLLPLPLLMAAIIAICIIGSGAAGAAGGAGGAPAPGGAGAPGAPGGPPIIDGGSCIPI